jgi:hypothetical protein
MLFNDAICQRASLHSLEFNLLPRYWMMPFVICQERNVMQHDLNVMMLCNMTWTLITKQENLRKQWHTRLLDSMPKFFFYRCPFSNSRMLYTPQYDTHDRYSVINWCNHQIISNNFAALFHLFNFVTSVGNWYHNYSLLCVSWGAQLEMERTEDSKLLRT